jgi:ABC-2 type transport system permease protein
MASAAGPIADLSYRNYDGPMFDVGMRWWVIAKLFMRMAIKKKGFWIWAALSAYGYGILSIIYYFVETFQDAQPIGRMAEQPKLMDMLVWKEQFYVAFSLSQLWLFVVTLLIGAGVIAADTRANALLVYLSKPVTKADYLFGKWLGMFLMILAVTALPALFFLAFTWLSYRQYGVWDSWLLLKMLLIIPIPAALHASVMLGLSSLFNQARIAGATYAGIFFLSSMVSGIGGAIATEGHRTTSTFAEQFSYLSIDGIINGLAKVVLNTSGAIPFMVSRNRQMDQVLMPPPNGFLFTLLYLGVCAVFVFVAWKRVRAVEVVG